MTGAQPGSLGLERRAPAVEVRPTNVFGFAIHPVTLHEAVEEIVRWCSDGRRGFVVTPNLDHAVKLKDSVEFRQAYGRASLVLPDGMPLVWASRFTDRPLPERVTGADLIGPLCRRAWEARIGVFIVASTRDIARRATEVLQQSFPEIPIRGAAAPSHTFSSDIVEGQELVDEINRASAQIVLVGIGSPAGEVWVARHLARLRVNAAVVVGSGIDVLAGVRRRVPRLLAVAGLEWAWRLAHEPRRLWRRYLRCAFSLPGFVVDQMRRSRTPNREVLPDSRGDIMGHDSAARDESPYV